MNAWSHLPNAAYIDRILESLKTHNDIWAQTYDRTRNPAREAAWTAARYANRETIREVVWDAIQNAIYDADPNAARYAGWNTAWDSALDATVTLFAWDDSAQFLELSSEKLEAWIKISDDPRAVLLLPAVRAFERIKSLETL